MGTGENSGTWGTITNTNLGTAIEEAIVGSADVNFSSADVTLTLTDANSSQTARNLRLNLTGSVGAPQNLIVPAIEKVYIVNNGLTQTITVKNTGGTGIAVPAGKTMYVYNNGTNVVDAVTHLTSLTLGTPLAVTSGGTGSNTGINASTSVTGILPVANGGTGSNTGVNLQTTVTGTLPIANGGTGSTSTTYANLQSNVSGILPTANGGTGANSLANANIVQSNVATTFTALQTFAGSSSVADIKTSNVLETATISATAATGTIDYDITTQSVLYYTSNASANWTVNLRGSSGTTLNAVMSTGESITVAFLVTQGATAYYNNAVQVDGSSVTPKYQGGTAWASGNVSSIDAYTYTIVKTGSATFTVFTSQTQFK